MIPGVGRCVWTGGVRALVIRLGSSGAGFDEPRSAGSIAIRWASALGLGVFWACGPSSITWAIRGLINDNGGSKKVNLFSNDMPRNSNNYK